MSLTRCASPASATAHPHQGQTHIGFPQIPNAMPRRAHFDITGLFDKRGRRPPSVQERRTRVDEEGSCGGGEDTGEQQLGPDQQHQRGKPILIRQRLHTFRSI
jgi:hypothetical protein